MTNTEVLFNGSRTGEVSSLSRQVVSDSATPWTTALQATVEWVAISSPRGPSWPRDRTCPSRISRQILYCWATGDSWTWTKLNLALTLTCCPVSVNDNDITCSPAPRYKSWLSHLLRLSTCPQQSQSTFVYAKISPVNLLFSSLPATCLGPSALPCSLTSF